MGRSLLVSSPKAKSTRMKSILALVLLGVAIIHLGGATEEETDTQVAQQESQFDLIKVQELAMTRTGINAGKGKGKRIVEEIERSKGNKCGKGKKNCRRNRTKKGKKCGKGKTDCRRNRTKKTRSQKKLKKKKNQQAAAAGGSA